MTFNQKAVVSGIDACSHWAASLHATQSCHSLWEFTQSSCPCSLLTTEAFSFQIWPHVHFNEMVKEFFWWGPCCRRWSACNGNHPATSISHKNALQTDEQMNVRRIEPCRIACAPLQSWILPELQESVAAKWQREFCVKNWCRQDFIWHLKSHSPAPESTEDQSWLWQWYDFTRDSNHEWKLCPEF